MTTREEQADAPAGKLSRVKNSAFRLTPLGDAARGWLAMLLAVAAYIAVQTATGTEQDSLRLKMLAAIDTFCVLYVVSTWIAMFRATAADARQWALDQESGSQRTRVLRMLKGSRIFSGGVGLLTIILVSLLGLMFALLLLPDAYGQGSELLRVTLCVVGVVTAWMLLHTSFALYYTHLYYHGGEPGGLGFPGGEDPDPLDFAYFAFTVGISFAASDVTITRREIRRVTMFHGVLAFFYNTAILALVINIVLTQAG